MELKDALLELAEQIKDEIISRLHSPVGINPRVGRNTLIGSELEKSIDVRPVGNEKIVFEIADYYQYIVTGWRRTGNYPNTAHLFIQNVTDWVRRKGIRLGNMTENQIVWYLYRRMLIEGRQIAARPFINYDPEDDPSVVLPFLDDFFDKWADKVFELIISDLEKYFNE